MQVCPRASGCRVACRSFCLSKTGNNAERHACAGSVKDRLVERESDCLSDCCEQFGSEIDVAVFEVSVANREVTADLPAIELDVIEAERQLVEVCTAVGPHCFRNVAHDDRAAFACDLADEYMLVQFGVVLDILADEAEEDLRNEQANVGQRSLFFDTLANLSEECLDVFACEHCVALLRGHVEESLIHDFDVLSLLFRLCFFRRRCRFSLALLRGFFVFQFVLEVSDLALQLRCGVFVFLLLVLKLFDFFLHDLLLFVGRFGCFLDRFGEVCLSLFEICLLRQELLQLLVLLVDLGAEHQCFKHLSCLPSISAAWFPSTLLRGASSRRHAQRSGRRCWSPGMPGMCSN